MEQRTLRDLNTHEVYVLAKVLLDSPVEKRQEGLQRRGARRPGLRAT